MDLLFVLVHYRTPERLVAAVGEARSELQRLGLRAEVVVVDNSGDATVNDQTCTVISPGFNMGYAAAANLAIRSRSSRFVVLANPDVTLQRGALDILLAECRGRGAVGPAFYWDSGFRVRLPPTEALGARFKERLIAGVSPRAGEALVRRRWREHARRHWLASGPLDSHHLSGALLLFDRDALDRVGPLDENYQLYFEETDWLRRAVGIGVKTAYVPQAKAIHTFSLSASAEPRAQEWFAQSEALYRKRYGLRGMRPVTAAVASSGKADPERPTVSLDAVQVPAACKGLWIELSGSAARFPAAAEYLDRAALAELGCALGGQLAWSAPNELRERVENWWLTVTDDRGRQLSAGRL